MSYPKHLAEKKWNESTVKDSTVDDLANVLITLDGLGQEKKRKALIELLHRASMEDDVVWDWYWFAKESLNATPVISVKKT